MRPITPQLLIIAVAAAGVGCGGGSSGPVPPPPPPPTVQSVTVSPSSANLASIGETTTLTAQVALSNGSSGSQVPTWSTSNANVATVSSGTVTAVGNGNATITAAVGEKNGTAAITVNQVAASARVEPADTVIKGPFQLRGAVLDARGNPIAGSEIHWVSSRRSTWSMDRAI